MPKFVRILVLGLCTGCAASMRPPDPPPAAAPPPAPADPAPVAAAPPPEASTAEPEAPVPATDTTAPADSYADEDPSALQDFHPELDPHGVWVDDPSYGTVWIPNATEVGSDFVPYVTAGHWVYGNDYVWDSSYDWGWAPFHYGRWVPLNARGWGWVPGRQFAPAWVEWQVSNGYVGWAPTAPHFIWRNGTPVAPEVAATEPYVFCPNAALFSPSPATQIVVGSPALAIRAQSHAFVAAADVHAAPGSEGAVAEDTSGGSRTYVSHGPPPAVLGITASSVARPTGQEVSVVRAEGFSRPAYAVSMGWHAPVPRVAIVGTPGVRGRVDERVEYRRTPIPGERRPQAHYARPQPQYARPSPYARPQPQNARPQPYARPQTQYARPQPQYAPRPQPQYARPQPQARPAPQPRKKP